MPKFRSVDDVLDFAIAKEGEAHDFYVRLAGLVSKADLRQVIERFAVDELQHSLRLQAIKAGEATFIQGEIGSLGVAETTGEIEPHPEMTYKDLLLIAMTKEKAAFRTYTNLASIAKDPEVQRTLLGLAQEEAQHKLRLEIEYDWETA
ncbi:MAG: ferritin family protein [Sedimentisphaerales bacterium]|nr:ferritin family protein [Sedimentisphaerales bacterium]